MAISQYAPPSVFALIPEDVMGAVTSFPCDRCGTRVGQQFFFSCVVFFMSFSFVVFGVGPCGPEKGEGATLRLGYLCGFDYVEGLMANCTCHLLEISAGRGMTFQNGEPAGIPSCGLCQRFQL
jgi:hypothetical protein